MPKLKIGLDLAELRQPLRKALHTAAQLGVDGVEIDAREGLAPNERSRTALRQVRKMLDDLDLRVCSIRFQPRRGYYHPDRLDARVEATKAALELAHGLGSGVVSARIGRVPADRDSPDRRLLLEVLADLGAYGQRVGAMLAAETGTESGEVLAGLLDELPEGSVGVDFHPGRLLLGGFAPGESLAPLGRRVLHVHAADAIRDLAAGTATPAELGRGEADFPGLLAALDGFGYRGYYTLQAFGGGDPEPALAGAVTYLRAF